MKVYSSTRTRRETLYQRTRDARGSGAGARAQGQGLAVAAAPEACRCSAATCLREGSLPSPRSRVERTWPTGRRIGGTIRGVLIRSAIRGPRPGGCPRVPSTASSPRASDPAARASILTSTSYFAADASDSFSAAGTRRLQKGSFCRARAACAVVRPFRTRCGSRKRPQVPNRHPCQYLQHPCQ